MRFIRKCIKFRLSLAFKVVLNSNNELVELATKWQWIMLFLMLIYVFITALIVTLHIVDAFAINLLIKLGLVSVFYMVLHIIGYIIYIKYKRILE